MFPVTYLIHEKVFVPVPGTDVNRMAISDPGSSLLHTGTPLQVCSQSSRLYHGHQGTGIGDHPDTRKVEYIDHMFYMARGWKYQHQKEL